METTTRTMEIAKIILEQIKCGDQWFLMAVGAQHFAAVSETEERAGGLSFQVNGLKFKGWITIHLTWIDDYTIIFTNRKRKVVKKIEGVFCDQLIDFLDWVEKG